MNRFHFLMRSFTRTILLVALSWPFTSMVFAQSGDFSEGGLGNSPDTSVMDTEPSSAPHPVKSSKKTVKRHRRKGRSKKTKLKTNQDSNAPQEEVTDQREVSQQADQTGQKK